MAKSQPCFIHYPTDKSLLAPAATLATGSLALAAVYLIENSCLGPAVDCNGTAKNPVGGGLGGG
jgi:hypothetical protein